ncbi:MAG: thiol-disulfide oxidoreductase DCC family protein [Myxococcaceae bacterium]
MDTVLYDGGCRFCTGAARRLRSCTRGEVAFLSFRDPGVLPRFPGVTAAACEEAMHLVRANGRVFTGAEAVLQALRGRWLFKPAFLYYLPGLRQLGDAAYALVARRRFRLSGRECPDGTCHPHAS